MSLRKLTFPKASAASDAPLTNRTGRLVSSNGRCNRKASPASVTSRGRVFRRCANLPSDVGCDVRPGPCQPRGGSQPGPWRKRRRPRFVFHDRLSPRNTGQAIAHGPTVPATTLVVFLLQALSGGISMVLAE